MFPDHDMFTAPEFEDLVFKDPKTAIFYHEDFIAHRTGNHPEHPRRLVVMRDAVEDHPVNKSLDWVEPRLCEDADILRCHTSSHFENVRHACEMAEQSPDGLIRLDPDTVVSPDTFRAARRAVGACCDAVDKTIAGRHQISWCLVRPPGHHATPERSMGFCIFNNAACAAAYARAVHKLERVMIVDYDLHHGNGTQDIFYNVPEVLYTSIHQSYHYPGTGHLDEIGEGKGRGYTVNFPVLAGSGDQEFALYFREVVAPIAVQYKPELIIASVGFDAHEADHLGFLRLSSDEYRKISTLLRAIATDLEVGLIYTLEGGYSLEASAEALVECLIASTEEKFDPGTLPMPYRPSPGVMDAFDRLRAVHKGIWDL